MKVTLRIKAQYLENYAFTAGGDEEHWKPKGGQYLEVEIDPDKLMLISKTEFREICIALCENHSDARLRFEYLSHEVLFSEAIKLEENEFNKELLKHLD